MEVLWSLGHKKLRTVDKNIYSNQLAQKVIEGMKNGSTEADWVVWQPGWPAWRNLTEIEELMLEIKTIISVNEKMEQNNFAPPPLLDPEVKTFSLPKEAPVVTQSLNSEKPIAETANKNWTEMRKHKRVEVRLRCIIRSNTLTFRTFTKDISLGGVALEDPIPSEFTDTNCNIYITAIHIKRNLKFNLKMTQRPGAKFFSFEHAEQEFKDELNSWLEEYMNIDKKVS